MTNWDESLNINTDVPLAGVDAALDEEDMKSFKRWDVVALSFTCSCWKTYKHRSHRLSYLPLEGPKNELYFRIIEPCQEYLKDFCGEGNLDNIFGRLSCEEG